MMYTHNLKTMVAVPGWATQLMEQNTRDSINSTSDIYARVSLVHRALKLRCDSLKRVPLYVGDTPSKDIDLEIYYPLGHKIGLKRFIWLLEASALLRGGALSVALKNNFNIRGGFQFLNPFTITAEWDDAKQTTRFYQEVNGKRYPSGKAYWYDGEDAFWLREYSPTDDIGFGVSAASLVLGDAKVLAYMASFAAKFFEGGAMPVTMLTVSPATSDNEVKRIETFFERARNGIKKVIGIRGDKPLDPQTITPNLTEMAIPEVRNASIDAVAWAFDVPRTMLTADAANYATANQDANGFLTNTILPRCEYYQEEFRQLGINLRFAPEEMSELQADENERASAVGAYTSALAQDVDAALIAFSIMGVDVPESAQILIDQYKADKEANKQTMQENLQGNVPNDGTNTNADPQAQNQDENADQAQADLQKFQRKAIKAIERGKTAAVSFESEYIDEVTLAAIRGALTEAQDAQEVKAIFEQYEAWGDYPRVTNEPRQD